MWRLVSLLLILAGCPKNSGSKSGGSNADEGAYSGGFVAIDLSEDEDDDDSLFGSELMIATAECGDLIQLEPAAMMGKLSDGEIRCLDRKLRETDRMTFKDKLSRVLMADAWAKGDEHRWEGIARRHLEEVDRSDPDLTYKFALLLSKGSAEKMDEAMKWADVSLENRSMWTGDLHVKRVYSLYKLKALSAHKKWTYLEGELVDAEVDEAELISNQVDEARNLTKTLSREWLEYTRSAGRDTTVALQLCVSAAGNAEFCADG